MQKEWTNKNIDDLVNKTKHLSEDELYNISSNYLY